MEYLLPSRPQYPSVRSKEYLALPPAKLPALSPFRQSYLENQPFPSRYQTTAPPPFYLVLPQYTLMPPAHLHPPNQSYPAPRPEYISSSKAAPNSPLHHKSKNLRAGDNYPSPHPQSSPILPSDVAPSNHSYSLQTGSAYSPASNHP